MKHNLTIQNNRIACDDTHIYKIIRNEIVYISITHFLREILDLELGLSVIKTTEDEEIVDIFVGKSHYSRYLTTLKMDKDLVVSGSFKEIYVSSNGTHFNKTLSKILSPLEIYDEKVKITEV